MKREMFMVLGIIVPSLVGLWAGPAFAYLGPGAGLAAIGAFLALIVGVIAAFLGFLWYPVRRLLGRRNSMTAYSGNAQSTDPQEAENKKV
jgi:hypothetical protein